MHLSLCVENVFRCAPACEVDLHAADCWEVVGVGNDYGCDPAVEVVAACEVDLHAADCWAADVGVGKEVEKDSAVVVIVEEEFDAFVGWEA